MARAGAGARDDDLFGAALQDGLARQAPLAARLGPRSLDEVIGQEHLIGTGRPLRSLIEADRLSSIILWGPPGTGKTTIARLVAGATAKAFETLSAATAGVKEVRDVVERARRRLGEHGQGATDARRRAAEAKLAAVEKAVKAQGRAGAPVTRAGAAQLSSSFPYKIAEVRSLMAAAPARAQEASWREVATQRRLVGDLMGRSREPDRAWVEQERHRLRGENEVLLSERNQLVRERDDLRRRLDGARAQVSRLNEGQVAELFPGGPGPAAEQPG